MQRVIRRERERRGVIKLVSTFRLSGLNDP